MTQQPPTSAVRRSRWAALARLGLVLVLTTTAVVGGADACWACSCAGGDPAGLAANADVVLVGRVVQVDDAGVGDSSGDLVHYVTEVERVHRGTVDDRVVIDSPASGASCGLEGVRTGGRYLFIAERAGDRLRSGLCSGTVELGSRGVPSEYRLGPARAPSEVVRGTPSVDLAGPSDRAGGAVGPWWWVAGGLLLVGGPAAFVLLRRRSGRVPLGANKGDDRPTPPVQ